MKSPLARPASNKPPKVALLTGAGRGIGRATALTLVSSGYRVGLIDRDADALESVAAEARALGGLVEEVPADVTNSREMTEAAARIETVTGPTDVVIACAGVGSLSSATDLDLDGLREMLLVNVLGVANTIGAVLPGMFERGRGHVVGIASVAGLRGMPWMPGYSASKAAVTTYLEGLRPSLKRRGVRITTVYPGFVRTGITVATPFRKPVKMLEPEEASLHILKAVMRRPRDYTFPFSTRLGMGLLRRLPGGAYDRVMDLAGPRALLTEF